MFCGGMEEDLFPSMSMSKEVNSKKSVVCSMWLTRAEHQAYLTYAQSRYRWGN
jgi:DNA helicase-2/ATP-dependent DNA helicase PcrA